MDGRDSEKNEQDKDSELDILAQQELLKLTRQYRVRLIQFIMFETKILLIGMNKEHM